ncbi:MAG: 2Fe-2S iron-sulfur cluster-binding protein [Anaerolineae bacterium]|nr:2Fe-2S iron-sulfur cluster-binding protein [Anaerolineae bacterium]
MYTITLKQSGEQFEAEAGETIMEAAERAGIFITHSCLSGICRACMTRVLSGTVEHDPDYADELSIDDFEVAEGYRLLCSAYARSDVALDR